MLDLEVVAEPSEEGTDIVSVDDLKRRLRISHDRQDQLIADCINEAVDKLHGLGGELRRSIFRCTYRRYLTRFPDLKDDFGHVVAIGRGVIALPLPPLVSVAQISVEDDGSPGTTTVPADTYVVRTGTLVGEIELKVGESWPEYVAGPRAIAITYVAGYSDYPPKLKRMVAILAAHYYLNASASLNEPRVLQINRQVQFGMSDLRRALQVPLAYDDWSE